MLRGAGSRVIFGCFSTTRYKIGVFDENVNGYAWYDFP